MRNETEELHILHAGSTDHTPFPLHACATCHRLFQLAAPGQVRKHLIPGRLELCTGALAAPLSLYRSVVHLIAPPSSALACCHRSAVRVPVFDTFTQIAARVTCPGRITSAGKDQQSR
jgi:hypothetical protein